MAIGQQLADARKRQGITQEQLALDLPVSRESIAKYEVGSRTFQKDLFKPIAEALDDPEFYFSTWNEAAGHVSIPYFNGDYIDQHPASMKYLVQRETNEALDHMERICWSKPVKARTETEREEMKRVINEILDAAASMINLVAILCREYDFSMKSVYKQWWSSIKVRRWKR